MDYGIHTYPQWYPGLSATSSFAEFQASMHKSGHGFGTCPLPCQSTTTSTTRALLSSRTTPYQTGPDYSWWNKYGSGSTSTTTTSQATGSAQCWTSVDGDECYSHVQWAMNVGIVHFPQWYPGLTAASTFEAFQASMHASGHGHGTCPQPCPPPTSESTSAPTPAPALPVGTIEGLEDCRTATEVDECYGHVKWAMEYGIHRYPQWYLGLTPSSTFVEFQDSMHHSGHGFGTCPQPCSHERRLKLRNPLKQGQVSAPTPGSIAQVTISVPVTMSGDFSWIRDNDLGMTALRTVGQELLDLHEVEQNLVKVTMQTDAAIVRVSFIASVPAERASRIRIKNATEVLQIFQHITISNSGVEMKTATGELVESYLALSDMQYQVVARIVEVLPAPAALAAQPPRQESSALRGALVTQSSTESPTRASTWATSAELEADVSDASRTSTFIAVAAVVVYVVSTTVLAM